MNRRRIVLLLALLLGLAASEVRAQALRSGEFRINQTTAGAQWVPDVATAADGRFVVVWQEGGDNTDYKTPVLLKARLFDAAGKPRGGEILVARHKRPLMPGHAVAMAPDGRFVVVWGGGTENPDLVYGRRYAADGRPLGPRFPLARNTDRQDTPDVAMAADGSFVAAWTQAVEKEDPDNFDESAVDVFFRRFNADGRPFGPETLAIGGYDEQSEPRVAIQPDRSFIIACNSYGGESSFYDVDARLFDRFGTPRGDAFQVNDGPHPEVTQIGPSIAVAADGRFAITWTDWNGDFDRDPDLDWRTQDFTGVAIRFYAADGTPQGPGRSVNVFLPGEQAGAVVSALPNGGFLMLWTSGANQDGDGLGIFGRAFGADGKTRGQEFRVNINRTGWQFTPALSIAPNGKGAAVWTGLDSDKPGVFARLIGKPGQGSR
jgi:hypothetical protein